MLSCPVVSYCLLVCFEVLHFYCTLCSPVLSAIVLFCAALCCTMRPGRKVVSLCTVCRWLKWQETSSLDLNWQRIRAPLLLHDKKQQDAMVSIEDSKQELLRRDRNVFCSLIHSFECFVNCSVLYYTLIVLYVTLRPSLNTVPTPDKPEQQTKAVHFHFLVSYLKTSAVLSKLLQSHCLH